MDKTSKTTSYDVDSIQIHHGLDGIRVRPTMYLGDYGAPMLFQMQKEIIDNAIDERHAGRNNYVSVVCNTKTNETIVYDRGNGIPVGDNKDGINTLVAVFSMVHAGGKFNNKAYAKSAGTFGTGAAAVNAVSDRFIVWTNWQNQWYSVGFKQGKMTNNVQITTGVPQAIVQRLPKFRPDRGTVVYFLPDMATVSDPSGDDPVKIDLKTLGTYLRTASFMNPKLVIDFRSETHNKTITYVSENGVRDLVEERIKNEGLEYLSTKSFVLANDKISLCLSWSNAEGDDGIWSYVNGSRTADGGKHYEGLNQAYMRALIAHADSVADKKSDKKAESAKVVTKANKAKKTRMQLSLDKISIKDLRAGVIGVLNWSMSGATYSSQTKEKLSSNVAKEVENMVYPALLDFFNKNPSEATKIINKARVVADGREQFKQSVRSLTSMKKSGSGVLFLPNILASAPDATPDTRALYIVEGESAAGCFHIDTDIRLADGSTVTFKQMLSGPENAEYVGLSYDDVEHKQVKEVCCDVRITKYVTHMLEFVMSDGSVFQCTPDHPFLCYDSYQYLPARLFKNRDKVQSAFGDVGYDSLSVVRVSNMYFSVPQPVCDLTMPKHHNFVLANGMVVHNSAKKARDSSYQEVLELRGKLINAAKMPLVRLLASQPVRSIILSLGVDLSLVDADAVALSDTNSVAAKAAGTDDPPKIMKRPPDIFPITNMRVKHIYVLSDQDPDGSHIAVLALTLLWRFFPSLFYQGRVWVVTAKLYHAYHNGQFYFGDTHDECAAKMPNNVPKSAIVRAKGLAEYNPNVLRYVAFDRNTMSVARIFPPKDMDGYGYFESLVGKDTKARKTLLGL